MHVRVPLAQGEIELKEALDAARRILKGGKIVLFVFCLLSYYHFYCGTYELSLATTS